MLELLFTDLRIDEVEFQELNREDLLILCELYHCTDLKILAKLLIVLCGLNLFVNSPS